MLERVDMTRRMIVLAALICAPVFAVAAPREGVVLPVTNAVSSSHGTHSPKYPHYATQVIDGDPATCWSSQSLSRSNEWIRISLVRPSRITGIRIVNGWIPMPKRAPHWYMANHRAKEVSVQCDKRTPTRLVLKDTHEPQTFSLDIPGIVSNATVTVSSIYPNTLGGDSPSITITEIELLGENNKDAPTKQSTSTPE